MWRACGVQICASPRRKLDGVRVFFRVFCENYSDPIERTKIRYACVPCPWGQSNFVDKSDEKNSDPNIPINSTLTLIFHAETERGNVVAGCGVVVAPGDATAFADAIGALARDPVRREELGRAGRRYAALYLGREPILQRLVEGLAAVCAHAPAAPASETGETVARLDLQEKGPGSIKI
jgi:hypothetical protein